MNSFFKTKAWKSRKYREHVSRYPCIQCGEPGPSDPHHDRRFDNCGTGIKPPDTYLIPLCHECHVKTGGIIVSPDAALRFMVLSLSEFLGGEPW
jgi:hypothetical protein